MYLSVLIVDDDPVIARAISAYVEDGYEISMATSAEEALELLKATHIDIAFVDYELPGKNGMALLKEISDVTEVIMITSHNNMDLVIEAYHHGAIDFVRKPITEENVKLALGRSHNYAELQRKLKEKERTESYLKKQLANELSFKMVGESWQIGQVQRMMVKLGATRDTSVLITGDNGTGKELIARGIHEISDRKAHNFVAVNMAAIPETLFESEFFGHKKGAFTGADLERTGWLELAHKGTLFLDEIGEMPHSIQSKLLRVLEERKFAKVGSTRYVDFDVRIIAATNRKREELVKGALFRNDLFHRLATFIIDIPPLCERPEDIEALARHFLETLSGKMNRRVLGIKQDALDKLKNYIFPGNVRELRNIIERAVILAEGEMLQKEHIVLNTNEQVTETNGKGQLHTLNLKDLEKKAIEQALRHTGNNKARAAEMLNIKWNALDRRIKKYRIGRQ